MNLNPEEKMFIKLSKMITKESKFPGKGGIFSGLTISIVLMYGINNLRYMGITQLKTEALVSCLWAINVVFAIAILGYFTFLLTKKDWYHHLVQAFIYGSSALAVYIIYHLFPFAIRGDFIVNGIEVILILISVVLIVMGLVEFYHFAFSLQFSKGALAPKPVKIQYPESQIASSDSEQPVLAPSTEPISSETPDSHDQAPSSENPPKPAEEPVDKPNL
jgi:hypothetical protein